MRSILYITYDGLTDALGQSQILAYLKRLSRENRLVILSYEKEEKFTSDGAALQKIVDQHGLTWVPLPYTPRPPVLSTVWDIRKGLNLAQKLHGVHRFQIVHCRGYIAAIIGRQLKKKHGIQFIFDMRGWWPDEKKESGYWDSKIYGPVYAYFKSLEKKLFNKADFSISLTMKGKEEIVRRQLAEGANVGVVPTCVDFDIFKQQSEFVRAEIRRTLSIPAGAKVFVYSGSLGGNYDPQTLIGVFKCFQQLHPDAYLLILSKDQLDANLKATFETQGIERLSIHNVPFTQVTDYLQAGDVGFIYYKQSFSVIGRSPTKLGEYWASGLPVIVFKGIGDVDFILDNYPGSGVLLSNEKEEWIDELRNLQFEKPARLREYAEDYFHIDRGVAFYQDIYERLAPASEAKALLPGIAKTAGGSCNA